MKKIADGVQAGLNGLVDRKVSQAKIVATSNKVTAQSVTYLSIGVLGLGIIVAILLGFWIVRSVMHSVGGEPAEVCAIAERIAAGDIRKITRDKKSDSGIRRAIAASVIASEYGRGALESSRAAHRCRIIF
jgi:methyl-accepting chemotaxis protein